MDWQDERMFFPPLCLHMPQRCPTLNSVVELDLQLLLLRNASSDVNTSARKGSFSLCFHVFYAFLPKFFSMMVCSKVLNPPLCWGWKWAVFIWWRTLAVWLSWSDRRFLEAVKPTKLCSDTWPANRPENPPSWWVLHAKLPGPFSGPATVKSQKKRRNPLWQPLSREHWQGERSVERVWGIQLSHSQNVQVYNQSWGTILTFAWHLLLL